MTLELESFELLYESLKHLDKGFRNLPEFTPKVGLKRIQRVL